MNARPIPGETSGADNTGNGDDAADSPAPSGRIPQTALYLEVAERLRQSIFTHELVSGEWIDEQALAIDYGISRTPLREALKVLASEGLVTLKPRRGCYVAEISERDLDDIFPLMAMLEGRSAREAAQKCVPGDIVRLEQLHAELENHCANGQVDRFFVANQDFHRLIQELSGNRWLLQLAQDLRRVLKLTRLHSLSVDGRLQQSMDEHQAIMAALRAHDADAAEAAMREHLLASREALTRLAPPQTP